MTTDTLQSKNDPILDAQQLCARKSLTLQELLSGLAAFGWTPMVGQMAVEAATGIYFTLTDGKTSR